MKLNEYIEGLKKKELDGYRFKSAYIILKDEIRIVYTTIRSGKSTGFGDLNCIVAFNSDKILNSVKIDTYDDNSNDVKVWLDFLNKYRKEEVESFEVELYKNDPRTEIWIYKQRSVLNAIEYVTTIKDSIILN